MKRLLKQYNSEDTLLVVTSFPNPTSGKHGKRVMNAVGWHSEHILPHLAKRRKILALAENTGTVDTFSPFKNVLVKRIWRKGSLKSIYEMTRFILSQDKIKSVLVQFEFNVLGGTLLNLALLAAIGILRLAGKKVTFELHQVLTDVGKVSRHINLESSLLQFIYNVGLRVFYFVVGLLSNEIIVFEEEMRQRLKAFVDIKKINVLCLPVEHAKTISKREARKKLGLKNDEFLVLQFGFINGYKGIDFLLAAVRDLKRSGMRILIAGGKNPYLADRPFYQRFYNSIVREAGKIDHVTYHNFVPDKKVYLYFSASDLVVLPYTAFMSASGPFSRALAYRKPVIFSDVLSDYAKTQDFKDALDSAKLKRENIMFPLKKDSVLAVIKKAKTQKAYYKRLVTFSKKLAEARNIENVASRFNEVVSVHPAPAQRAFRTAFKPA